MGGITGADLFLCPSDHPSTRPRAVRHPAVIRVSDVGVIRRVPVLVEKMSEDLRSRVNELETTVDALTDEIVDLQKRLDEIEGDDEKKQEVGVGVDENEDDEDDIRVA
jgi:uncharacterized protein YqgV (UPF0045/DUF77 family)